MVSGKRSKRVSGTPGSGTQRAQSVLSDTQACAKLRSKVRRWRQLTLGDLVEQRLVADLENARGLGAIPLHAIEHFHEGFALGFARAATRDLLQALADKGSGLMGWSVPVPTAREQGLECLLTVGQHHHASNHVLQFSDIARPRVLAEASHRLGRELLCATVLRVEPGQERRRQERNLLFALPEGGNANLDHVEAVVEGLSEFAPRHRLLQVSIRGGDDARVDIDEPMTPHPRQKKVLEHME